MGSKLSVVNDTDLGAWVEVRTAGGVFVVASASLRVNEEHTFDLGKVWYELDVRWNDGMTARQSIYMGEDVRVDLSTMRGLGVLGAHRWGDKVQDFLNTDDFEIYITKFGKPDGTVSEQCWVKHQKSESTSKSTSDGLDLS